MLLMLLMPLREFFFFPASSPRKAGRQASIGSLCQQLMRRTDFIPNSQAMIMFVSSHDDNKILQ